MFCKALFCANEEVDLRGMKRVTFLGDKQTSDSWKISHGKRMGIIYLSRVIISGSLYDLQAVAAVPPLYCLAFAS